MRRMGVMLPAVFAVTAAMADGPQTKPPARPIPPIPLRVPDLLPEPEALQQVNVDPSYRQWASHLGDPSFETRERASRALLDAAVDIPQLCVLLTDEELESEQRYRLLAVLQHQIVSRPRGALGIRMQTVRRRPDTGVGIEITDLVPGLPAENVLRLRDRITHIDDYPVRSQDDLAILIQSKQPGEAVSLRIDRPQRDERGARVRDEEGRYIYDPIEVQLTLGSVDQLIDPETGLASVSPTVQQGRLRQSQEAARRFRPQPRTLRLADGQTVAFTPVDHGTAGRDKAVDDHPAVQSVLMQRRLISEGHLRLTDSLHRAWRDRLRTVIIESEDDALESTERLYLQRVALRLAELIGE